MLRAGGPYTQAVGSNPLAAQTCALLSPSVPDASVLEPGDVALFLTTGVSGGIEGGLGQDSLGDDRPNANPCP